jgi:hypothetical protein
MKQHARDSEAASGQPPDTGPGSVYPEGIAALVKAFEFKQLPFDGAAEALPAADSDLAALWQREVSKPGWSWRRAPRYSARRKYLELTEEFIGQPEILLLHAFLSAVLRRGAPPPQAPVLFQRLWEEEGERLARTLPMRWLISAATTFGDCGTTPEQRACGMGLSVMIDMIKLHDSERRYSGKPGDEPFNWLKSGRKIPIAFDLSPYAIVRGDLDRNLLARLWKQAEGDPAIRPLGFEIIDRLMAEPRTVFARFQELRRRAKAREDGMA